MVSRLGPVDLTEERKKSMLKALFLAVVAAALTGCMALRVSQNGHDNEIARMNLPGSQFKDAVTRVEHAGFTCHGLQDPPRHRPGKQPTLEAFCFRRTPELWCPQERRVIFDADAATGIVAAVETPIIDKSCW